jgi:DNA-binding CsgD family transcriptional regulator
VRAKAPHCPASHGGSVVPDRSCYRAGRLRVDNCDSAPPRRTRKCHRVATPNASTFEQFVHAFAIGGASLIPEMAHPPEETAAYDTESKIDLCVAWAMTHLREVNCTIAVDDLQHADHEPAVSAFLSRLADTSKTHIQWLFSSRTQSHLPITRWQVSGDADAPITADELRMTEPEVRAIALSLHSPATPEQLDSWVQQTRGFPVPLAYAIRLSARHGTVSGIIDGTLSVTFDFLAEQLWASMPLPERTILEVAAFLPPIDLHAYADVGVDDPSSHIFRLCDQIAFLSLSPDGTFSMHDLFREFLRQRILLSGSAIHRSRRDSAVRILVKRRRYDDVLELLLEPGNIDDLLEAVEELAPSLNDLSITRKIVEATGQIPPDQLGLEMLHLQTQYYSWFDLTTKSRRIAEEVLSRKNALSRHLLSAMLSIHRIVEPQPNRDQREWLTRMPGLLRRLNEEDRIVGLASQAALLAQDPERRDEALSLAEDSQQRLTSLELRERIDAQILITIALFHVGDLKAALKLTGEAVLTARSLGDTRELARTLDTRGLLLMLEYDPEVESIFEPLRDAVEKTGSWRYAHASHWFSGAYYAWKGDRASATAYQRLLSAAIFSERQTRDLAYQRVHTKFLCYLLDEDYAAIISDFAITDLPRRADVAYDVLMAVAAAHALSSNLGQSEIVLKRVHQIRESLSSREMLSSHCALFGEIVVLCAIGKWQQAQRMSVRYQGTVSALEPIEAALKLFCEGPPFVGVEAALQPCLGRPYMGLAALLMTRVMQRSREDSRDLLLTGAEMEILRLIGAGKSNKDIASARGRSAETVKRQVASLFRKLGVENRTSAVAIGRERGLL